MVLALDLLILFLFSSTFWVSQTAAGVWAVQKGEGREGLGRVLTEKLKPVCLCTLWGAERSTSPNWSRGPSPTPPHPQIPSSISFTCYYYFFLSLLTHSHHSAGGLGVLCGPTVSVLHGGEEGWVSKRASELIRTLATRHIILTFFPLLFSRVSRSLRKKKRRFIIPVQLWA